MTTTAIPQDVTKLRWGESVTVAGGAPMAMAIRSWAKDRRKITVAVAGDAVTVTRASRDEEDAWCDDR